MAVFGIADLKGLVFQRELVGKAFITPKAKPVIAIGLLAGSVKDEGTGGIENGGAGRKTAEFSLGKEIRRSPAKIPLGMGSLIILAGKKELGGLPSPT